MEVLTAAYIRDIKKKDAINLFIPKDIIGLILLFYMYDLSGYEYLAIFLVKEEPFGHFAAFNIDGKQCNIYSEESKLCQEELGTTIKMFELSQFKDEIWRNLFPKYRNINLEKESNKLHVMFRLEGENTLYHNLCTAVLLETDDTFILPLSSPPIDRCGLLQSKKHGLIAVGGYAYKDSVAFKQCQVLTLKSEHYENNEFDKYDDNPFYWDKHKIPPMNITRSNQGLYMMEKENKLFVCGGWTSSSYGDTKSAELYSFDKENDIIIDDNNINDKWINVDHMNSSHLCHGIIHDQLNTNNMFIVGGTRLHQSQICEQYDFHKNIWRKCASTIYPHKWFPALKIKDGSLLICTGNHYNYNPNDTTEGWGYSEFLDLRDYSNKWQLFNQKSIHQILGYTDTKAKEKKMRGIWSL